MSQIKLTSMKNGRLFWVTICSMFQKLKLIITIDNEKMDTKHWIIFDQNVYLIQLTWVVIFGVEVVLVRDTCYYSINCLYCNRENVRVDQCNINTTLVWVLWCDIPDQEYPSTFPLKQNLLNSVVYGLHFWFRPQIFLWLDPRSRDCIYSYSRLGQGNFTAIEIYSLHVITLSRLLRLQPIIFLNFWPRHVCSLGFCCHDSS